MGEQPDLAARLPIDVVAEFIAREVGYESPGMREQAGELLAALEAEGWVCAAADLVEAHRDAPPLADLLWLLHGSRMTLDAIATGREGWKEAAAQAQRIVDHLGHAVTDEPPHTLVENDQLRERLQRLLDAIGDPDELSAWIVDHNGIKLRQFAERVADAVDGVS